MKQKRLSIGCKDWQAILATLGPETGGVLLYLLTLMRSMQAPEISLRIEELAGGLNISTEAAGAILTRIEAAGYLTRVTDMAGVMTLRSEEEEKRQDEARRKRAARMLSRSFSGQSSRTRPAPQMSAAPRADGQSDDIFFVQDGQSADSPKSYTSEVMIFYDPNKGTETKHTQSTQIVTDCKKEKAPRTPEKEKSLTEINASAYTREPSMQPELPSDQLEADYIDICGIIPKRLRETLRNEQEDVREAFYLYNRQKRKDEGEHWTGDRIQMAWLAARRIPAERRADSILAAAMGGWKTIRDAGSGVYFEKSTGRVVSLVRGPVEYQQSETRRNNAELAVQLAKRMRKG